MEDSSAIILTIILILLAHSEHFFPGFTIIIHFAHTLSLRGAASVQTLRMACFSAFMHSTLHFHLIHISHNFPGKLFSSLPTFLVLQRGLLLQATHGKLFSSLPTFLVSTGNGPWK
jgi:hypothetical protein